MAESVEFNNGRNMTACTMHNAYDLFTLLLVFTLTLLLSSDLLCSELPSFLSSSLFSATSLSRVF